MPIKNDVDVDNRMRQDALMQALRFVGLEGISLTELAKRLNHLHDWNFNRRTYNRDIIELSLKYQITELEGRPKKFLLKNPNGFKFQTNLNEREIQTITLALDFLRKSAPIPFGKMVKEVEISLHDTLDRQTCKEMDRLKDKHTAGIPISGKGKLPNANTMFIVLEALRKNLAIQCDYCSPYEKGKSSSKRTRKFLPLVLEMVGGSPYLLVQELDSHEQQIKRIKVFRVQNPKIIAEKHSVPEKKLIDEWKTSFAGFGGPSSTPVKISLVGDPAMGVFFDEHEIHPEQVLTSLGEDKWKLEVEMPISLPLIRLFVGLAQHIHRINPSKLRQAVELSLERGMAAIKNN